MNSLYPISDETIQILKENTVLCHFPKRHQLIEADKFCKSAYFIEEGMTRSFWLVNGEEITTSFACEGAIVFSMDELYYNKMSEEFVETLEDVVAYRISPVSYTHLVIKDAAAASLYGSRAANGVILITTKKGNTGKVRVDLNVSGGFSHAAVDFRPTLNGDQRKELLYEGLLNYAIDRCV